MKLGYVLAPKLHKSSVDWVKGEQVGKKDFGIPFWEATITDLGFADNLLIFSETLEVLMHTLDTLSTESKPLGLKVFLIPNFIAIFD